MALTIDAAAVAHNASVIRTICDSSGLTPRGMFKNAYALPLLVEAAMQGGIWSFYASSRHAARRVSARSGTSCGLCGSEVPFLNDARCAAISDLLCTTATRAGEALVRHDTRRVWLSVMTSDGRDGIAAETLDQVLAELLKHPGAPDRLGIAFNWGCLGGPPERDEVAELSARLQTLAEVHNLRLPVSIGGSALLPALAKASVPGSCELRVGEALVAGTVPESDGKLLGLRRPFTLSARIVDIQHRAATPYIVIDRGATAIDPQDVQIAEFEALPVAAASEVALFALGPSARLPALGRTVELALGYQSMLRSLLNRTIARQTRAA